MLKVCTFDGCRKWTWCISFKHSVDNFYLLDLTRHNNGEHFFPVDGFYIIINNVAPKNFECLSYLFYLSETHHKLLIFFRNFPSRESSRHGLSIFKATVQSMWRRATLHKKLGQTWLQVKFMHFQPGCMGSTLLWLSETKFKRLSLLCLWLITIFFHFWNFFRRYTVSRIVNTKQ